jgi:hypothetical protein
MEKSWVVPDDRFGHDLVQTSFASISATCGGGGKVLSPLNRIGEGNHIELKLLLSVRVKSVRFKFIAVPLLVVLLFLDI